MNWKYLLCFIPLPVIGIWVFYLKLKEETFFDWWAQDLRLMISSVFFHLILNGDFAGMVTFWMIK